MSFCLDEFLQFLMIMVCVSLHILQLYLYLLWGQENLDSVQFGHRYLLFPHLQS